MKNIKFLIGLVAILIAALGISFVLRSEHALVVHPKGVIAKGQLDLMITNILLMLAIIVPTFIFLFFTLWSQLKKQKKAHDPDYSIGSSGELLLWVLPSIIVVVMSLITWKATHELDPFKPLESPLKPLRIEVVALDWKWLFIYPEQEIATVNWVQFPAGTPIHFNLSADGSPMNSFWIPQLSGQIYSMAGMITQLHLMADEPGQYTGRAAEINGEGFADMLFTVKTTSEADFDAWIAEVKKSPLKLTDETYNELLRPSIDKNVTLFSTVEKEFFNKIVDKNMSPTPKAP